jgi:urea transporter/murein DD-endopeptidase MepM/ murein hydrolase activator NlpD
MAIGISNTLNKGRWLFPHFVKSILNSYTQIFFSDNRVFALILIMVTFFDWVAGLSGVLCVVLTNLMAYIIGFNRKNISSGFYGFNSLLTGLALGIYYQMNYEFLLILLFASMLSLFFTLMLEGVIGKYGLPFLSLPFLLAIWMLILATRQFTHLRISERGIFILNDLYNMGGQPLVNFYQWFGRLNIPVYWVIYFRSLGAIFFQYHIFAGMLMAIGLLIYSRIGFLLSLVGFFSAYWFYAFIGADISELNYNYIGFNFILTAIAIGGFFVISSRYSFLWVILLVPLISITISSASVIMNIVQLPVYSLPFNIIVLLFLYAMKFRERFYEKPQMVLIQHYSPEKNLYLQHNSKERFGKSNYFPFSLPFWGEWKVTQAHNGDITHKGDWKQAWDFEIADNEGQLFQGIGNRSEDYYCYNKPVIAPLGGLVEEIVDNIDDNDIGNVNLDENWGNTIVIKHAEGLYSKICHLKKEGFRVKTGDYVKKGDIIAYVGNSGRSPQPHLHFQFQATPFIGSKTLDYPLGHYILNTPEGFRLKSFERPDKNDKVMPVETNASLMKAFHFIPGQMFSFEVVMPGGETKTYEWEVIADYYNNTYIWCKATSSKLWFTAGDEMIYFTHFEGRNRSLLFYFYLACYKVLYGYYKDMTLKDTFPVSILNNGLLIILQDFVAPFFMFLKTDYQLKYISKTEDFSQSTVQMNSQVDVRLAGVSIKCYTFEIFVKNDRVEKFTMAYKNKTVVATNIH